MSSPTFRDIFVRLAERDKSEINYFISEGSQKEVETFSWGASKIGHTIVNPLKGRSMGRSMVNRTLLTNEVVVHEVIHAAAAYTVKGFETGVPGVGETGHAVQFWELRDKILDEVKAAREKEKEEKGSGT